jgi:hypothetical protein
LSNDLGQRGEPDKVPYSIYVPKIHRPAESEVWGKTGRNAPEHYLLFQPANKREPQPGVTLDHLLRGAEFEVF